MASWRGSIWRGAVLAAAMAVGACTKVDRIPSPFVGCGTAPPDVFEAVDWNAVRRLNVSIRHDEYQPSLLRLYQGRAYILRIENRDRNTRSLRSAEFFNALFIHSVVTGSNGETSAGCPSAVLMRAGEVAEVRFIAARDGRYEFSGTLLPMIFGGIPAGIIHIEQAPPIVALLPPVIPGITKTDEEIPIGPYAPAALPVPPPAPETPAMPADPAALPLPLPAPETPAMPADPAALPLPLPAPETPTQPVAPAAIADEPPSAAPMIPLEEEKGPAVQPAPLEPPATPQPPRSLLPEHAPGNVPARKTNGGGLFGQ